MIFVTVGEQLPFDRLIRTVDYWAGHSGQYVYAQTGRSKWKPSHIKFKEFLSPNEFKRRLQEADIIISHAGMGTIISAVEMNKPLIVMPRKASLKEARSDHQFSSAKRFLSKNFLAVANDESELKSILNNLDDVLKNKREKKIAGPSPKLIKTIRNFVES
jgi:UDP-N-acetylglucosamine transferase subunit ALG13